MKEETKSHLEKKTKELREEFKKWHPNETPEEVFEKQKKLFSGKLRKKGEAIKKEQEQAKKENLEQDDVKQMYEENSPQGMLKGLTSKTIEEIVDSGTAREVAYLFATFSSAIMDKRTLDLSPVQINKIAMRLSRKEKEEVNSIFCPIIALKQGERGILYNVVTYQKDAAYLANVITEWKSYERLAEILTELYSKRVIDNMNKIDLEEAAKSIKLEHRSSIYFDSLSDSFKVDIGKVEDTHSLRRLLRMRGAFLAETMRIVKAYEEATREYIKEKNLPEEAIPYLNRISFKDIANEYYIRGLIPDRKYYEKHLWESGLELSEDSIEKAVFPNYETTKALKQAIEIRKKDIYDRERQLLQNHRPFGEESL